MVLRLKVESETVRVKAVLAQVLLSAPRLVLKVRLGVWLNARLVTKKVTRANSFDNTLNLMFSNYNYII